MLSNCIGVFLLTNNLEKTTYLRILILIGSAHFLNDLMTSVVPSMLPILQKNLALSYTQLGTVVMVSTVTASLFQPIIGLVVDKKPFPWVLPISALFFGIGLYGLGSSTSFSMILMMVAFIGLGSATFHPEGSRVAHLASGVKKGMGQSVFQVGGNAGQAVGPLMIPLLFIPFGLKGAHWLVSIVIISCIILIFVSRWYKTFQSQIVKKNRLSTHEQKRYGALSLLVTVVCMRSWIHSGISSFLPVYYTNILGLSLTSSEVHLFVFLFSGAIGTFFGGVLSDYIGKKNVLIFSMVGCIPFMIILPYLHGFWSYVNVFILGFISLSSFAVTVVYAHYLLPGKIGLVSGLMIGFAIGMGGIGASVLGGLADKIGLGLILQLFAIIPLFGWVLSIWLPNDLKETNKMKVA